MGIASDIEYEPESSKQTGRQGFPVDPARVLSSLRKNWKYIPLGALIGGAIGAAFGLTIKHSYISEAVMIWEPESDSPTARRELATQANLVKLPATLDEVAHRLGIKSSPEKLANQIEVWIDVKSNLITVEAGGDTAKGAAKLADTVVEVFIDQQQELSRLRSGDTVERLKSELATARKALADVQQRYDAFRQKHGIADFKQESSTALSQLQQLKSARDQAQANSQALVAMLKELSTHKGSPTRITSSSSVNSAASQLAQAQSQLASMRARLAPGHPQLAILESQVESLKEQAHTDNNFVASTTIAADPQYESTRSSIATTKAQLADSQQRERSFSEQIEEAQARVNALAAIEGEAQALIAEVQRSQSRVDGLMASVAGSLDGASNPPSNFRVLSAAVVPKWPQKSKRRAVALGATVFGILVALLIVVLRPLMNRRVYTAREAAFWANLPVVGSTAWPSPDASTLVFADELNDEAAHASGTTLVIAARSDDIPLAHELARHLGPRVAESMKVTSVAPPKLLAVGAQEESASATQSHTAEPSTPPHPGAPQPIPLTAGPAQDDVLAKIHYRIPVFLAWNGIADGQALRRAARMADRVLVLVRSGCEPLTDLLALRTRLGREDHVALAVVGMREDLLGLPDRVGDHEAFWHGQ